MEGPSRKRPLPLSLSDDEDPNKSRMKKKVRFPKGKKVKAVPGGGEIVPGVVIGAGEAPTTVSVAKPDLSDPKIAAKERADRRNQFALRKIKMTTELCNDDEFTDITDAEVNYQVVWIQWEEILGKQIYSLELIFQSIKNSMKEFDGVVVSLEKNYRDGRHLANGASRPMTESQMQKRVGIQPSIADCINGLKAIYEMHQSEYLLKLSIISSLVSNDPPPSANDLGALQQLLIDQPNIPKDEVRSIFDIIFADEIC